MARKSSTAAKSGEPAGSLARPLTALADFDREALAARLSEQTGRSHAVCSRAVSKCYRLAFRNDHLGAAQWNEECLRVATLGKWVRAALLTLTPDLSLRLVEEVPSRDGTVRLLLGADDGALIESVIIPALKGGDHDRTTLCVSSQVGCGQACSFCHTATLGLQRQLGSAEIVDQVRIAARLCSSPNVGRRVPPISNIVFMGMGEPLDNLDNVLRAVALLTDPYAFAFAPSRITVSTAGVADKLASFFASTRAELAISLNAVDDPSRSALMPINKRFDLSTLRRTLLTNLPSSRRVLFQYVLFADINDSPQDARRLAKYIAPIPCRLNVIPANPSPNDTLATPTPEAVNAFVAELSKLGVTTLVRRPRGLDVGGACGQLIGERHRRPEPPPAEQIWS